MMLTMQLFQLEFSEQRKIWILIFSHTNNIISIIQNVLILICNYIKKKEGSVDSMKWKEFAFK